jgi:predicted DNA-binding transcriptional regulator YafY
MIDTSARLLRLLTLLQARRFWTAADLARRLEITERTVRRDVDRLRSLGYPVRGTSGTAGGYELGAGATLPPLLLEDDEAAAVSIALRAAAGGTIAGLEQPAVRALAKLEQVLPTRVRRRVEALGAAIVPLHRPGPPIDPALLVTLAGGCRDREALTVAYRDVAGATSERSVEPHGLVHSGQRWYLVAWDRGKADWRTFRVDRIAGATPTGARFTPRRLPAPDLATYVSRAVSSSVYPFQAKVVLHAPREAMAARISPLAGQLEALDERRCLLRAGAGSLENLAAWLAMLGVELEVLEPRELVDHLRTLAERIARAAAR